MGLEPSGYETYNAAILYGSVRCAALNKSASLRPHNGLGRERAPKPGPRRMPAPWG
jgi:hypothetical protein